jgi:hypothetical protein
MIGIWAAMAARSKNTYACSVCDVKWVSKAKKPRCWCCGSYVRVGSSFFSLSDQHSIVRFPPED